MRDLKLPLLFFVLIYLNQGFSSLPSQSLYYLTAETWGLNATNLGWIGFITGIAWMIKPVFGAIIDKFPIKGFHSKYYLYINYLLIILGCIGIGIFGLNLITLILSGVLLNTCVAFCDVANDKQMVILEQKHDLKGKVQAVQWTALGVGGLAVSIFGAMIAKYIPEPLNYKIAYGLTTIIPMCILYYLYNNYEEAPAEISKKRISFKKELGFLKDKSFLLGLAFIACLNFCPSFGTPLMMELRSMNVDKMFLGWLSATGTVLGLVGYALYYVKAHKFPLRQLLYFAVAFSALTNLFYLHIPNQWYVMAYSVMFGAFSGISFLAMMAYMASIVPRGNEALFYALVVSVNNLSAQLGNVFGGMIYDNANYKTTVIASTVATLACLKFIPHLKIKEDENVQETSKSLA